MSLLRLSRLARATFAAAVVAGMAFGISAGAIAENAKVRIAMLVADSMLPAMYANEKGYFKDAGIDAELIPVQGGPAVVAAVAAGEAEVGYAAVVPPINGRLNGVPVKLFLVLSHETNEARGIYIAASGKSGIKDLAGVKGKKISFNANGGLCELAWRDHLAAAGLKIEDTEVVVLPFPEQEAALDQGNIDAVCTINPFYASMKANANLGLADLAAGMLADLSTPLISDGLFAKDEWLSANTETAQKIAQVMDKARTELLADRTALEAAAVKHMELSPEAAKSFVLPVVKKEMNIAPGDVQRVLDAMIRNGMQQGELKAEDFSIDLKY
jgi:ABC-type nitrate/sulfonate/bicarbonate transport system substrate-binding protein